MDFFEAVDARYSYRDEFTDDPVPRGDLEKILRAGLVAPSGCNKQTTTFVCVTDPEIVKKIGELQTMKACKTAGAFICCCIDREPEAAYKEFSFQVEDCAAAVENMLLAVSALGYASVWIDGGLRVEGRAEKIGEIINVPESKVVRVILPVGRPVAEGPRREKMAFAERAWFDAHG